MSSSVTAARSSASNGRPWRPARVFTSINPWIISLFETLQTVEPESNSEQSAFDEWLGLREALDESRRDRLHSAEGIVPPPIWLVLFFSAGILLVFMLFFADSGERAVTQGFLMGSVTAVVVATLLTLAVLSRPYSRGYGGSARSRCNERW